MDTLTNIPSASPTASLEQLVAELGPLGGGVAERGAKSEKRYQISKVRYSHDAMVDLIVQNPWVSQNELAAHFGYSPAWVSIVLGSDAFQAKMAQRREEVINPELKATIEERFRALTIRSLDVLQDKLAKPNVSDQVALRCAELGAKALGVGGNAPPPAPDIDRLERLAGRLIGLQANVRQQLGGNLYEGQGIEVLPGNGAEGAEGSAAHGG